MTLDEAIKHCEEVAEQKDIESLTDRWNDGDEWSESIKEDCKQCAADHRQLAEWLTDYKELKNSIGAAKFSNMKEALELIREYKAENIAQKKLIAEYKRLLKAAAKIAKNLPCDDDNCGECVHNDNGYVCSEYECFEWRYADEALALIGENGEQNG